VALCPTGSRSTAAPGGRCAQDAARRLSGASLFPASIQRASSLRSLGYATQPRFPRTSGQKGWGRRTNCGLLRETEQGVTRRSRRCAKRGRFATARTTSRIGDELGVLRPSRTRRSARTVARQTSKATRSESISRRPICPTSRARRSRRDTGRRGTAGVATRGGGPVIRRYRMTSTAPPLTGSGPDSEPRRTGCTTASGCPSVASLRSWRCTASR
jgi:hypothetical protein